MNEQDNLHLIVGRVEGKIDSLLAAVTRQDERHDALSKRVSSLERWRSYTLGASAAIGAIISVVLHFLKAHV
jgi:hypothetical protein